MKTVRKFPLSQQEGVKIIKMPKDAQILHADLQDGWYCVWAGKNVRILEGWSVC